MTASKISVLRARFRYEYVTNAGCYAIALTTNSQLIFKRNLPPRPVFVYANRIRRLLVNRSMTEPYV